MKHSFRSLLVVAFVLCTSFQQAVAQQMQFPPLPVDKNVRIGQLDNGLTYYIRHNKLPENRAEFSPATTKVSALSPGVRLWVSNLEQT